jgi:hypothetical protein
MTSEADPMLEPSHLADDTRALLERAGRLSAEALAAVDAGDGDEVLRLLLERGKVLERSDACLRRLRTIRDDLARLSGPAASAVDGVLAELRGVASALEPPGTRLMLALESERDRLGRELDQIESDGAVRTAYGQKPGAARHLDVVR